MPVWENSPTYYSGLLGTLERAGRSEVHQIVRVVSSQTGVVRGKLGQLELQS